jgi:hypothetical protein
LATRQWGAATEEFKAFPKDKIVRTSEDYIVSRITIEELKTVIKKVKRRKAPGPDEIPIEVFKEMDDVSLIPILHILNKWWVSEELPNEMNDARIVLIFKKGSTSNLENYRPISLLNTMYKIFAAIVQNRLADKLDKHLQRTQFGFRKNRSTAQALQCIRRVADHGEQTNTKTIMLLLGWEEAFDKVTRHGLFSAIDRMGVDPKIQRIIKALYKSPRFKVEIDGVESQWHEQRTGIRQGCPLSPYLFLIVMTVMFHDIHEGDRQNLIRHRVLGTNYDEVLYADDTICI